MPLFMDESVPMTVFKIIEAVTWAIFFLSMAFRTLLAIVVGFIDRQAYRKASAPCDQRSWEGESLNWPFFVFHSLE